MCGIVSFRHFYCYILFNVDGISNALKACADINEQWVVITEHILQVVQVWYTPDGSIHVANLLALVFMHLCLRE